MRTFSIWRWGNLRPISFGINDRSRNWALPSRVFPISRSRIQLHGSETRAADAAACDLAIPSFGRKELQSLCIYINYYIFIYIHIYFHSLIIFIKKFYYDIFIYIIIHNRRIIYAEKDLSCGGPDPRSLLHVVLMGRHQWEVMTCENQNGWGTKHVRAKHERRVLVGDNFRWTIVRWEVGI
jgi:hypothetical protein